MEYKPTKLGPFGKEQEEFDAICKQCGVCCGSEDGDPCIYLEKKGKKYYCKVYNARLGPKITVKGNRFRCISIKEAIEYPHIKKVCAYAKLLKRKGKYEKRTSRD